MKEREGGVTGFRRSLYGEGLALLGVLGVSGCALLPSHVHDKGQAEAAVQARDTMSEYSKGAPKMYVAMLANVERFKVEEEYLLSELHKNVADSLVTKGPSMTWQELSSRAESNRDNLRKLKASLGSNSEQLYSRDKKIRAELPGLEERVNAAKKAVQSAKDDVTNWNATVAVFREALQSLPLGKDTASAKDTAQVLEDVVKKAGSKNIEYVDADGKTVKEPIKDVLQRRVPDLIKGLREPGGGSKGLLAVIPDAPGIDVVIANLGLELAQSERQRAEIHLAQTTAVKDVLEDALVQIAVADVLLNRGAAWAADKAKSDARSNVFEDIMRSRLQAREKMPRAGTKALDADFQPVLNAIDTASLTLQNVRDLVVAESIVLRVSTTLPVALERLDHVRSITESGVNDRQYESLIRSGLSGLAAYHEGGLTSDDVANVIRFAQAVAVGVVAGRVP
jgi:hypothetical protein